MRRSACLLLLLLGTPAAAQEPRELCTARPSLGTSACIVDRGRLLVEFGVGEWTRESDDGVRTDTVLAGDALARLGVTADAEIQIGWIALGHVRERDRTGGTVEQRTGSGDVTLAWRQNLRNPDGSGTSFGVQPFVTIPVGRRPIGAAGWNAGLIAPVSFELSDAAKLVLTPEVDALADEDGGGHHLAYGGVAGVELALTEVVAATVELAATRDRDPADPLTETLAALTFTWQPGRDLQFDAGAIAGLNHQSADFRLLAGVSARF